LGDWSQVGEVAGLIAPTCVFASRPLRPRRFKLVFFPVDGPGRYGT